MARWTYTLLVLLAAAGVAHAGFRHPVEETSVEAIEIQHTPIPSSYVSSKRIMPDRIMSSASPSLPTSLPANVKPAPGKVAAPAAAPGTAPKQASGKPSANQGPIPQAPSLPDAVKIGIPAVNLPTATRADGLLSMKPEALSLKGSNRAQLHAFVRHARGLPFPKKDYTTDVRSREVAERYRTALHPTPYQSYRTKYKLDIDQVGKIEVPPPAIHYENTVKRIDSLFYGLENSYAQAVQSLWELSQSPNNPRPLQARDALFAGIISERAGWETPAAVLLAESAAKRAEQEERYLNILWEELENINNATHIENVVAKVSPHRVVEHAPAGDKANFAMAKRMLLEKYAAPIALRPSAEVFSQRIRSTALRDRVRLLSYVGQLRSSKDNIHDDAVEGLQSLESDGDSSVRQEARLALARDLLKKGNAPEALALYRNVEKNGKNRLEVLAEQTYSEYLAGEYQESIGKAVALQSPYFQYGFSPDVSLVEILARKSMCDFGGAEEGVKRFNDRYGRELAALEANLQQQRSPVAYYDELVNYVNLEKPMRYQRFLLQLPAVMENQKTLNQALGDLKKIDNLGKKNRLPSRPAGWDAFSASMQARWGARAQELRKASAEAALNESSYLAKRLRSTFAQVQLLDLDISTSAAKNFNLQSALNFPARKPASIEADVEKFHWPFEEEVWQDEIDFMKSKNPSKCATTATAANPQ